MVPKIAFFLFLNLWNIAIICANTKFTSGLTLNGPKCLQKTCKLTEYCSEFDNTCQSCALACDKTNHNFEESVCENQCQDYLHDVRYVRKSGTDNTNDDLRVTVAKLSRMITGTITLVVLMLIILLSVFAFQLYRWKVKKNITWDVLKAKIFNKNLTTPSTLATTTATNNPNSLTLQENKKHDLRIDIPSATVTTDLSPITSSSIDRKPAEDSTLDYAYDNPAMTKSTNNSF